MLAPGAANTVSPDLRFIFNSARCQFTRPATRGAFGCAEPPPDSPDCHFSWPFYEGVDFSRLGNWREWLGFFEHPQAAGDFVGVYDTAANEGVARVFPSTSRAARKVLAWAGPSPIDWHSGRTTAPPTSNYTAESRRRSGIRLC